MKKLSLADLKGWDIYFDEPSKEMILIYKGQFCCVSVSDEAIDEVFELEVFSYAIKKDKTEAKRARYAFWHAMNKTQTNSYPINLHHKFTSYYIAFIRLISKLSALTGRIPSVSNSERAIKVRLLDDTKPNYDIYGLILGIRKA